jgi:hypothetical protein
MLVDDQYAGQTGPCARCGGSITIPHPEEEPPPASSDLRAPVGRADRVIGSAALFLTMLILASGVLGIAWFFAAAQGRNAALARRSTANLNRIGMALLAYRSDHGSFPPAQWDDSTGQPIHSWRVLIQPYLDEEPQTPVLTMPGIVYSYAEPWNGPNNRLIDTLMPPCYSATGVLPPRSSETHYVVVEGPGFVFNGTKTTRASDITDDPENTLLVIEVARTGITWMEPRDFNETNLVKLVGPSGEGVWGLFADGSVRQLTGQSLKSDVLRDMLTISGGEAVAAP